LWVFVSVDEQEEKGYLVTVLEVREFEVFVTAYDEEDATAVAEEFYLEDGVLWTVDIEATRVVEQ